MRALYLLATLMLLPTTAHAGTVRVLAAGSLKAAMTEIARDFEAASAGAHTVETVFGPSGALRERIEGGEAAAVFASADMGHPGKLAAAGLAQGAVHVFARNSLCGLARAGLAVGTGNLLDVLLDPAVKVGVSTPKVDPAGDYALALFAKAEAVRPGAQAILTAKALQLAGGPTAPKPPEGRTVYGVVMAEGKADLFLTYCTNAIAAKAEVPGLTVVAVPDALSVGADYGLVVLKAAGPGGVELAAYIRSKAGQAVLARYGFGAGD